MKRSRVSVATLLLVSALAGCGAPSGRHAPIVDHSVSANGSPAGGARYSGNTGAAAAASGGEARSVSQSGQALPPVHVDDSDTLGKDWRPRTYTVQKGDTLYGIAFNFGLDYRDIAALNGITDPTVIHAGQVLRLFPAAGAVAVGAAQAGAGAQVAVVSDPLVVKLPYSSQAVAQVEKTEAAPVQHAVMTVPQAGAEGPAVKAGVAPGNIPVKWEMPASGRVVAAFSEADNRKGIDIAGNMGQPVYASAPGKVVYSGSGLRGYGKLVIIKHNEVYLSAYAHNSKLMVREGQMVSQGQMIAQMGDSDASRVALHFEIRKLGRPVDPAKYLVLPKS